MVVRFRLFALLAMVGWLIPWSLEAVVIYDKQSQQKAIDYGKQFTSTGLLSVTKKGIESYGSGALVVIEGTPCILTSAHVVAGASKVSFLLPQDGSDWSIPVEVKNIHVYPLYLKLKDKALDVALIPLDPKVARVKEAGVEVTISWVTQRLFPAALIAPLVYDEAWQRLIAYAGYGRPGSFDEKGYGRYQPVVSTHKRGAQMRMVPVKNIFFEHGCGVENSGEGDLCPPEGLKKIAQDHFSLNRDLRLNEVKGLGRDARVIGAFSPGDSGAPLFVDGYVVAVVATADRPLVEWSVQDFYGSLEAEDRQFYQSWDQQLGDGSFGQGLLRSWVQWHKNVPEFSIRLYQTATVITPTIYAWMRGVVGL